MSQTPAPIPVYAGDDWSFAFTATDSQGGSAIDLTGVTILGLLIAARSNSGPTELTETSGQAGLILGTAGKFGLGVPSSATVMALTPSTLQICYIQNGLRRTVGAFPLSVLAQGEMLVDPIIVTRSVIDPLTGYVITFDGPVAPFPAGIANDLNFDVNNGLQPALTS